MTGPPASTGPDEETLDWEAFCAAHFPRARRHDFEAIVSYGAYRRSPVDEQSPEGAGRTKAGTNGGGRSTALQGWEDEGGATR